ncbi:MAG: RluA family pseudouridine synthase [bacterium]|nr:RluA family pseudouridine synthase [bacterium]
MNAGFVYRERIRPAAAGVRVDAWLAARYAHSTADEWRRRIAEGRVELDGAPTAPDARLRPGQELTWRRPPWIEPPVPLGFAVLAADADLLVVAKPAGLPTAPAGGFLAHTLQTCVQRRFPEATPVHRLGRGTSGLVMFARSDRARRQLARCWREGAVERDYRALVRGDLAAALAIDVPIGSRPHPRLGRVHAADPGGRAARTELRPLRHRDAGTVVGIAIATGRPHQIRIHCAAAGHPLVGDPLYGTGGVPPPDATALPGDGGYLLHAIRLAFPHPADGRPVVVECAPPRALRV